MTEALHSHVAILRLNTQLFLNCLEGVIEADGMGRVTHNTNSLAFIAVHLVDARHFLAQELGLELAHPFAETLADVQSIDDTERLPSLVELRTAWEGVSAPLTERLAAAGDQLLDASPSQAYPVDDPSMLGGIAFLLQHEAFHIGQMALLRKQLGYPSMSYPTGEPNG
ncbi:MAG: DinB family protein [Gemmatimonadota bacterium]|nr:MAG: DinB family protein [Gemmatimonadota bacterium]